MALNATVICRWFESALFGNFDAAYFAPGNRLFSLDFFANDRGILKQSINVGYGV